MIHHIKIENTEFKRRLVIPDIHGCYKTLDALLDKIKLTNDDLLVFLGDYIDRGPSSIKVVNRVKTLMEEFCHVYALRGNHEEMLLDQLSRYPDEINEYLVQYNSTDLLMNGKIPHDVISFFRNCYYYIELTDCFLVHAGFNFNHEDPLSDQESMLWIRGFTPEIQKIGNKFVVHGHDPKILSEIKNHIKERNVSIPLDNGCVHLGKYPGVGKLLCLELNSFKIFEQDNIDQM